ncbi:FecR domain-containing protein [Flavobacterium buctense]|uniref:FecR domain-containing protein n=1 Tax=Flavobacterium buctense TaxID=1648146 RepID=A0ABU9E2P1_9FLAO|nr:FecR domain-containing protein [Flavobacterium buctense]
MEKTNETYLSDWLAHKITDEQLKQLVSEEDFLAYQNIKVTLDSFEISNPDLEQNFSAIKQKLADKKQTKSKVIPFWRFVSIAASLLILFGVYHFFMAKNEIVTGFGNTQMITLTDNSKVSLNAKSKLSYANTFQYKRTLQLDGEAFFEVEKGSPFTVETSLGDIRVLGTKFNVIAFQDFFEVKCYEGKVQVTQKDKSTILTHGESVRFYKGTSENWADESSDKPTWISGESSFKNVPMRYVIEQFKKQYNMPVDYPKTIENVKFTGTFTHNEPTVALQTICLPLHLKFGKDQTGKMIISE